MDRLIYALNFAFLLSCIIDMGCRRAEQRFSVGIVRTALLVPLLALEYLYLSIYMQPRLVAPVCFSEGVFSLCWILLALNLRPVVTPVDEKNLIYRMAPLLVVAAGLTAGGLWITGGPYVQITGREVVFPYWGYLFTSSLFVLLAVLIMAWRLEAFWRSLDQRTRRPYKYLLIGFFLMVFSLGWFMSYRITYLRIDPDHLMLLSLLLFMAWVLSVYAIVGSRLLNRKIFLSRQVVYATLTPLVFAVYLILIGIVSLFMRIFDWSLHFVLEWLLVVSGFVLITAFVLSHRVRARVRYFISTHFYINKYEYRDEWLNFSQLLQHDLTEAGVVEALHHTLSASLYTDTIRIWVGDEARGFSLSDPVHGARAGEDTPISSGDPLVAHLRTGAFLDAQAPSAGDGPVDRLLDEKAGFLEAHGLVLLFPVAIGGRLLGIIGLGPEYTGGRYAQDDFDLLAAIGSQAASALLSVRTAEELARAREQNAWNTLSTFVLHDIKNAATMLSLIRENAPRHIHKPKFQEDLLISVGDALRRINKVETRLNTFRGDILPSIQPMDPCRMLEDAAARIGRKLMHVKITIDCRTDQVIHLDPDFMAIILENLAINAMEAKGPHHGEVEVRIRAGMTEDPPAFQVDCRDNGPGIPQSLLPDRLFDPFISDKPKGSGIGLWQVSMLVKSLGGTISARNRPEGGAQFSLTFPQPLNPVEDPAEGRKPSQRSRRAGTPEPSRRSRGRRETPEP